MQIMLEEAQRVIGKDDEINFLATYSMLEKAIGMTSTEKQCPGSSTKQRKDRCSNLEPATEPSKVMLPKSSVDDTNSESNNNKTSFRTEVQCPDVPSEKTFSSKNQRKETYSNIEPATKPSEVLLPRSFVDDTNSENNNNKTFSCMKVQCSDVPSKKTFSSTNQRKEAYSNIEQATEPSKDLLPKSFDDDTKSEDNNKPSKVLLPKPFVNYTNSENNNNKIQCSDVPNEKSFSSTYQRKERYSSIEQATEPSKVLLPKSFDDDTNSEDNNKPSKVLLPKPFVDDTNSENNNNKTSSCMEAQCSDVPSEKSVSSINQRKETYSNIEPATEHSKVLLPKSFFDDTNSGNSDRKTSSCTEVQIQCSDVPSKKSFSSKNQRKETYSNIEPATEPSKLQLVKSFVDDTNSENNTNKTSSYMELQVQCSHVPSEKSFSSTNQRKERYPNIEPVTEASKVLLSKSFVDDTNSENNNKKNSSCKEVQVQCSHVPSEKSFSSTNNRKKRNFKFEQAKVLSKVQLPMPSVDDTNSGNSDRKASASMEVQHPEGPSEKTFSSACQRKKMKVEPAIENNEVVGPKPFFDDTSSENNDQQTSSCILG